MSISKLVTCDLCGKTIDEYGGGKLDFAYHDYHRLIYTTWPPQDPAMLDICNDCRSKFVQFIKVNWNKDVHNGL